MNKTELFYSPRQEVIRTIAFPDGEPEMTEFESAFLCGLIKERKPKKIVEVGIAGGGTTAILLECLSLLGMNETAKLYSVDLSELFYKGKGERSGYLSDIYKNNTNWNGNHIVKLGKYLPEVLDEIGSDIDFVILDTVHSLPGEILDFLAVYPYLSRNACVVLHDIANNHYGSYKEAFATQVLMDCVVGEKYILKDESREYNYPNIGAFVINEDTGKYMADVFNSLMITWGYFPEMAEIEDYMQFYKKYYPAECVNVVDMAYKLQCATKQKHQLLVKESSQESWRLSKSYRIGRAITYLPRIIRDLFN